MKDSNRFNNTALALILALGLGGAGAACAPIKDYRGYVQSDDRINQISEGSTLEEVETALGTPSAKAAFGGKGYYYISSVVEQKLFFAPKITERKILAVHFDEKDIVANVANYGLKDGVVFDFISRKTPTRGKELNFLQQMFGNLGKFNKAGGAPGVRGAGTRR